MGGPGSPASSPSAIRLKWGRRSSETRLPRPRTARDTAPRAMRWPAVSTRPGAVIDRLPARDRSYAAAIVFGVGHPVADAGDDRSAGPIMELVIEFRPEQLHGALPRRHVGVRARPARSRRDAPAPFPRALSNSNDGWRSNAIEVLRPAGWLRKRDADELSRVRQPPPRALRDPRAKSGGGISVVYRARDVSSGPRSPSSSWCLLPRWLS